ncbi:hypothetical protein ACHAQJ_005657 [Trichoderma viride]
MEEAHRHQLYTIYEADEIDSSYENAYTDQISATRGRRYNFMYDNSGFLPWVARGSSSAIFEPSSLGVSREIDDDYHAPFSQQFNFPLILANTHLPPLEDFEYDCDDEREFDEGEEDNDDDFIHVGPNSTIADMRDELSSISDEYEPSSADVQRPSFRSHRGRRRWEPYYPRQARRLCQPEAECYERNMIQNDGICGDYAMINGEDEDELSSDSSLNVIDLLDRCMLPTVQYLEFFHRELEEEDTDTDIERASDWFIVEWE